MKKVFMGMFAIATMLLATSCSEDELIAQSSGNEVSASFKVSVRSDVKTKAVGDDTDGIDQLIFAVYDENKNLLEELTQTLDETKLIDATDGKKTATINVTLVKGQTYSFAFWAQDADYAAYTFTPATKLVSVNYVQTANNKNADAFFANETLTVSGSFEKDITLKRPFAQVNFLTTKQDILDAQNAGFDPKKSSIVVKNAATSLNVLEGTVTGSTEATFNLADILLSENTKIKNGTQYVGFDATTKAFPLKDTESEANEFYYLATAYFLTTEGATGTTIDASMNVVAADNGKMDLSVSGVKAQRNFRTNIYGNLLTSGGKFNVTVDPGFDGDYSVEVEEETVTYDKLSDALNANKDNTEALTYNVESTGEQSNVSIIIPAGTNAASLTFSLEDLADNATISVSNAAGGNYENPVVIEVPEGVNLGALTVEVPNAHVTLKQGSYTTVESTTSSTTLEVGAGTTIGTLTVNKGNVRIAEGGEVETIANSTDGTLYVLMAGGEWIGMENSKDQKTIVIYEDAEHAVALNDKYSADNMSDLMSYNKDVLNATELYFELNNDIRLEGHTNELFGSEITKICIDGKSLNSLTFTDTYRTYIKLGNADAVLELKDINLKRETTNNDTHYHNNNMSFYCNTVMNNVSFDKGITFNNAKTYKLNNVTISKNKVATYALFIFAGCEVSLNNCTITRDNSVNGRGIKIVDEDMTGDIPTTTLKVSNTKFNTAQKSAILVGSEGGANIILSNNDISEVLADTKNEVWVDEDYKDYFDKVSVTGGYVAIEGIEGFSKKEGIYEISTSIGLATALLTLTDAGSGNCEVNITEDIDLTGEEWTPVEVDGYHGADIITIDGNGATITGLTASLFKGGFAGGSGIVIKNLTIQNSQIVANNTQGYGAFVGCADSMDEITLINCHLKESSIITPNDGKDESRIGGLIGWTAGYNNQNDGPVDSYITVKDCSVTDCTLKGAGSIGGIVGHAGANAATYTTIENCTVTNCKLSSTDDGSWRVGVIVGTANNGQCVIKNITDSGNTLTQTDKTAPAEQSNLYGRFVPLGTGTLVIDGKEIK